MTTKFERRGSSDRRIELRASDEGTRVEGHAAVFNEYTNIAGVFLERIAPGAFADALNRDDVVFNINHDGLPLARRRKGKGTLHLEEDDRGLFMRATLDPSDPDAARILPKMARGDLDKMSFAFRVEKEEWEEDEKGLPKRTIQRVALQDVSVVTFPAYEGTDIALRGRPLGHDLQEDIVLWRAEQKLKFYR